MQYISWLSHYHDDRETAVTFGKFDGLHRGHQILVDKVRKLSEKEEICSVVCSFDMHPLWEEKGILPQVLMTGEERKAHLDGRVDYLVECPFTQTFRQIQAEDFIQNIVKQLFHAKYVVVGTDFRFGYEKHGDVQMLSEYAKIFGYELFVMEKERYHDRIISSTYIKEVLKQGDMELVRKLLGYYYSVSGRVEHGRKLGRTLGFPTLNVAWPSDKIVPPYGVYLCYVWIDGRRYQGISNVGVKPTVSDQNRVLTESFLFDYHGDAYGKEVTVELLKFCRPECKFDTVDELKSCIDRDIESGKHFFTFEK